jgi:squalene-hopene/tetraprenyl-beta-curcumene cyclase
MNPHGEHSLPLRTMLMLCVERPTWPFSAATCRRALAKNVADANVKRVRRRLSGESPDRTGRWPVPPGTQSLRPAFALLVGLAFAFAAHAADKPKPKFQYESGDIRVSIPTADEPRVKVFGPESIKTAVQYLEHGAVAWVREKSCVNCHTTGPYMTERTAWTKQFGPASEEVLKDFVGSVPKEVKPVKETETRGHKHYPNTFYSVWRSLGLAEWDRHITGKLSEPTERSLRDMFERQSANGAFASHGEVEIPHITTDFELTLQAVRAITAAPGWLVGLKDEALLARVAKLKEYLRTTPPKNDFDRVLKLQLAHYLPELVPQKERDAALKLLSAKQHADGGWCVRDFSALDDWHFEMSTNVVNLIKNLPDAARPESDAYMTALAIVLLRQSNVPAADPRIQRGLAWLKREQRETGRWWMHSLYRGNYHYITYIATAQALKAFALCDELPSAPN